jgi:hypothetical protein
LEVRLRGLQSILVRPNAAKVARLLMGRVPVTRSTQATSSTSVSTSDAIAIRRPPQRRRHIGQRLIGHDE